MNRLLKILNTLTVVLLFFQTGAISQQHKSDPSQRYALLVGGCVTKGPTYDSYYKNIEYVAKILKKLNYENKHIKILFSGGQSPLRPIVQGDATKVSVMKELRNLEKKMDSNDSLLLFRSGHGMVELIFERYGILSKNETVPVGETVKVVGTAAVACFPDGSLSYLELLEAMRKIKAKQKIIILNQCFSGQFAEIAWGLENTVVITQTGEVEIAFKNIRKTEKWGHDVWPFVKCLFDGFIRKDATGDRQSVFQAFQYMLKCNPYVEGFPLRADRPLLRESPQINYGNGLKKGAVYVN